MKRIFLVLFIMINLSAFGWGGKGHAIIADIADQHLTKKAKREVEKILKNYPMTYHSSWLDEARDFPGFTHTSVWHYGNVDDGYTYETMPKSPGGDVVTATIEAVAKLKDKSLSDSLRRINLYYLIHLVGDMHCPMHAGRTIDLGGNKIEIYFFGEKSTLHRLWDDQLIEGSRKWSYTEWRENIDNLNKAQQRELMAGTPHEWINVTADAAKMLYEATPAGSKVSYAYMSRFFPLLEQQLLSGGYHLAYLLNEIFE